MLDAIKQQFLEFHIFGSVSVVREKVPALHCSVDVIVCAKLFYCTVRFHGMNIGAFDCGMDCHSLWRRLPNTIH